MTKTFSPFFAALLVILWLLLVAVERASADEAVTAPAQVTSTIDLGQSPAGGAEDT
jgi:hypothetical protein